MTTTVNYLVRWKAIKGCTRRLLCTNSLVILLSARLITCRLVWYRGAAVGQIPLSTSHCAAEVPVLDLLFTMSAEIYKASRHCNLYKHSQVRVPGVGDAGVRHQQKVICYKTKGTMRTQQTNVHLCGQPHIVRLFILWYPQFANTGCQIFKQYSTQHRHVLQTKKIKFLCLGLTQLNCRYVPWKPMPSAGQSRDNKIEMSA